MATDHVREAEWTRHAQGVRRLAHALVYDPDLADDVAQEALRIAMERPAPPGGSLRAWLSGIVRNVARNAVRGDRHRRERERTAARPEAVGPSPSAWTERLATQRRVIDAVLALEEPYRTAVVLRYFEDLSPPDVAARTGSPLETVRTRLRRARALLRSALDDAHGGDRRRWALALLPLGAPMKPAAPAPWITGALAMKKVVLTVVLLALVALPTWWFAFREPSGSGRTGDPHATATGDGAGATLRAEPSAPPAAPARAEAPAPVDLASVDRDRDVHGVVVSADGTPVPGARVRAVRIETRSRSGAVGYTTEPVLRAESSSSIDGTFALRLERGEVVDLRVEAAGFATWQTPFTPAGGRVRVVLGPAVRMVVVVMDERKSLVAAASVRFFQSGSFMVGRTRERQSFHHEGLTGADGRCVFEAIGGGLRGHLDVKHPAHGHPGWLEVTTRASGEQEEIVVLPAGRTLRGRVTDETTGTPIVGALVGSNWVRDRAVATDARGDYVFTGWTGEGTTSLAAGADGYVLQYAVVAESDTLDFALAPARVARGRVVDPGAAPVEGARVRARADHDPQGATPGEATTRADGRFELAGLRRDVAYRFVATREGHARGWAEPSPPTDPGAALDVGDIVLGRPFRVEGRVIDDTGAPVADIEVTLSGHLSGAGDRPWRVTDDLGRFRYADVASGTYTLKARSEGREPLSREVAVGDRDVIDIEFRMSTGAAVEVLLDAEGAPPPLHMSLEAVGSDGVVRHAHADELGRVVFVLPPGPARLRANQWPLGWLRPAEHTIPAGTSRFRFSMRRAATVSGVVRTADGGPVPGAEVSVRTPSGGWAHRTADLEGRFSIDVEPGSRVDLSSGGAPDRRPPDPKRPILHGSVSGVDAAAKDVVLVVREVAMDRTLRVRVLAPDGTPLAGATVSVQPAPGLGRTARTDDEGRAGFDALPSKPVGVFTMPAPGGRPWLTPQAEVIPDGQEVVLAFRVGLRVEGRVVGPEGAVEGASVEARHHGKGVAWGQTRVDGTFAFPVDPDGHFPLVLRAYTRGDQSREIDLEVPQPPGSPVEIRIPR